MKETIVRLGDPFAHRVVGEVAIVTGRHSGVTGVLPGIIGLIHDVTIHTGLRVVAEVTCSLPVAKSEQTQPG